MRALKHLLLALSPLFGGCVHTLPPPPTPPLVLPVPYAAPLETGKGRLYLDVVDGPTDVRTVTPVSIRVQLGDDVYEDTELQTEHMCHTPCVLDLPLGEHLVAFPLRNSRAEEVVSVPVAPMPTLYRRALGWRQSGGAGLVLGVLGTTFGGMSLATGATFLPIGLATGKSGFTTAGAITAGVGAMLTAMGIYAINSHPSAEQHGAGAQYPLPP